MTAPLLAALLPLLLADPTPKWLPSLEEAQRAALKSNRPIFLVFRCEH